MNLLFRRKQTQGRFARVQFKLWCKIELDETEDALIGRYALDNAILIDAFQPRLLRNAALIAVAATLVAAAILSMLLRTTAGGVIGLTSGAGSGYWFFHENRETILVRDLMHGRNFSCPSVIELARKEAWLETITGYLRQVMESARHWDGTETHKIEPLPRDEARQVILRGL